MNLPNESKVRSVIEERLRPEFSLASEILATATRLFAPGSQVTLSAELPDLVFVNSMALLAKACKQYRAIGELAALGLGEPCDSLSRMLFETMLAVMFVLREKVVLQENGKEIGIIDGKELTAMFRCQLYAANEAIQCRKVVGAFMKIPALRDQIPESSRAKLDADAAEYERVIGPEWTKRVEKRGYAGVNVLNLASSMGMEQVYASVYKIASGGVHAADAMSHVGGIMEGEPDFSFRVSPDPASIPNSLCFASMAMVQIIEEVDNRFTFGLKETTEALSQKTGTMRLEFPDI